MTGSTKAAMLTHSGLPAYNQEGTDNISLVHRSVYVSVFTESGRCSLHAVSSFQRNEFAWTSSLLIVDFSWLFAIACRAPIVPQALLMVCFMKYTLGSGLYPCCFNS